MIKRKPTRPVVAKNPRRRSIPKPLPTDESELLPIGERALLTVLVYLCGDCHIKASTDQYLAGLLAFAPSKNIHLVVQYDTAAGAKRYLVRAGESAGQPHKRQEEEVRRDVNTGDQAALEEFLAWGLTTVSAEHHVLILSGLGINPRYVRQSLQLSSLPEALQKVRGGRPGDSHDDRYSGKVKGDPNDAKYSRVFAEQVERLGAKDLAAYRDAIHQRTFSICHDFSNSGSLEITALRDALMNASVQFDEVKQDSRFELILLDAGAAAFVEVLFELEGLARVFIGSPDRIPDSGLPYTKILKAWDKLLSSKRLPERRSLAHALAESFLTTIQAERRPQDSTLNALVAVNLDTLDEVARVLDALAVALLHSIGDWHVLDATQSAIRGCLLPFIKVTEPGEESLTPAQLLKLDDVEFVPAVNLFDFLAKLEAEFFSKLESGRKVRRRPADTAAGEKQPAPEVPVAFGQRARMQKLYRLIRKTVAHLKSNNLLSDDFEDGSLFLGGQRISQEMRRLLILLPSLRNAREIANETGKLYSLSSPTYARLNFSKRVHWSALIGAIQMIHEKPHALWRVISSMLADASSPARDAVLSRLISKQSVVYQLRGQFRSLGDSESLTLSLDFNDTGKLDSDLAHFQVRLEPSLGGAIVYQQDSRVYKSSLDSTWRNLNTLLHESQPMEDLLIRLRALGASLGEDIIQDMAVPLENERNSILLRGGEAPHLTIQMAREFMRFPWELMNDGTGMLCERYALGRQVFMEASAVRPSVRRASDLIRVLIIGNPTYTPEFIVDRKAKGYALSDLPSARIEAETIDRAFRQLNDEMAGVVEFDITSLISKNVSTDDMRLHLREGGFDLIHYAGHAFFNKLDSDGSAWILSDGLLHAREIRNTLAKSRQPPWLIFANACEAGMDSAQVGAQSIDVTGLATACINMGVAAYIAPLWPVDDEIARWMAVGFYRELLRERYSVGESLRRARVAIWERLRESGIALTMPAKTALTWSSFVLYGDPTARLLQTLWSPTNARTKRRASETKLASRPTGNSGVQSRFRSATSGQLESAIDLPSNLLLHVNSPLGVPSGSRATGSNQGIRIELVERDGLRFWRTSSEAGESRTRTFSPLGDLLDPLIDNEKFRHTRQLISSHMGSERGVLDFVRVIKSWVVSKYNASSGKSLITDLAAEFDRQQVPDEQLFRYVSAHERRRVMMAESRGQAERTRADDRGEWMNRERASGQNDRALLILHGTFSNCAPLFNDFQQLLPPDRFHPEEESESLLNWMLRRYRAVLGFDHWTLSRSPEENAELLLAQLPRTWRAGKTDRSPMEIDILCHSRGGLVARAFIELLKHQVKIRRVVMVAVPNAGTRLANPNNWGRLADIWVNQVSQDPTGLLGRLSGLLFYLVAQNIRQSLPGLQAMRWLAPSKDDPTPFLSRLQKPSASLSAKYFVVAANYVPPRDNLSLQTLLKEMGDQAVDQFFEQPNDLVVETASMWATDAKAAWADNAHSLPPANMLLFNTLRGGPKNLSHELQSGVHHTNYFVNRTVRDFIRKVFEG